MRLTPRAARNEITGVVQDSDGRAALQVRLTAPPVESAANKALIAFLAEQLGIRKADIAIRSGESSRQKILHLTGNSERLIAKLGAILPSSQ